jgi:hypothetical protein
MLQPGPSVRLRGLTHPVPRPHSPRGTLGRADLLASEPPSIIRENTVTSRLTSALEGFSVVDTTQVLAAPTAARTLAEFGAEVIRSTILGRRLVIAGSAPLSPMSIAVA